MFEGDCGDLDKNSLVPTRQGLNLGYYCLSHGGSAPKQITISFEWHEVYLISKGNPTSLECPVCHGVGPVVHGEKTDGCDLSAMISKLAAHRSIEDALVSGLIRDDYLCKVLDREVSADRLLAAAKESITHAIEDLREERSHGALLRLIDLEKSLNNG